MFNQFPVIASILDFQETQKSKHFVEDYAMNVPAMFDFEWFWCFREEEF